MRDDDEVVTGEEEEKEEEEEEEEEKESEKEIRMAATYPSHLRVCECFPHTKGGRSSTTALKGKEKEEKNVHIPSQREMEIKLQNLKGKPNSKET